MWCKIIMAPLLVALGLPCGAGELDDGRIVVFTARDYETDERLFEDFEQTTGISVLLVKGKVNKLIDRMKAPGPIQADVFMATNVGKVWEATVDGLLQPVSSRLLESRLPVGFRHPEGYWFGFSARARIIVYDRENVPNPPLSYSDIGKPEYAGKVCTRTAKHPYMVALLASVVLHEGVGEARRMAEGMWRNRARDPKGGDTDQIRGIVSGECQLAVVNSYYLARAIARNVEGVTEGLDRLAWHFPDQHGFGTHVDITAAGIREGARNRAGAIRFLEYLASDQAQAYFADGNNEYTTVPGTRLNPAVQSLGSFTGDLSALEALGFYQPRAESIYARAGYQ